MGIAGKLLEAELILRRLARFEEADLIWGDDGITGLNERGDGGLPRGGAEILAVQQYRDPVWSKISNTLKRLGFHSHKFLAQLLSETSRACTIRVRRSTLERLWNELGSHACVHHRNRRPGTSTEERISGRREPDPKSPNQRPVAVIRCRKSYAGGDRPPAGTESLGRVGGCCETGYAAGLVPKAHRH